MKKIIRLTETDLVKIVNRVINEQSDVEIDEADLMVDPYKLTPFDGKIRITNSKTKQALTYKLQKPTILGKVDVDVEDFPMGKYIKVSAVGQTKVMPIDKELVKNTISSNWGKKEIVMKSDDGNIHFVRV